MATEQVYAKSVGNLRRESRVGMIVGERMTKRFGDLVAIRDVDVSIESGKITALIGPSGGGKTSVLRALSLVDPPDKGTVKIDDRSYEFPCRRNEKITPPWPRVTVVFQQLFLWPHMTLRQNIMLPLRNSSKATTDGTVQKLIDTFDMASFIDRHPNETSLGQRQRAAIVRALALEPDYVFLDEVTSALDVEQVCLLLSCLEEMREKGVGVLLITHQLEFARRLSDQVVFLARGEVVEAGSPEILVQPNSEGLSRFLMIEGHPGHSGGNLQRDRRGTGDQIGQEDLE